MPIWTSPLMSVGPPPKPMLAIIWLKGPSLLFFPPLCLACNSSSETTGLESSGLAASKLDLSHTAKLQRESIVTRELVRSYLCFKPSFSNWAGQMGAIDLILS